MAKEKKQVEEIDDLKHIGERGEKKFERIMKKNFEENEEAEELYKIEEEVIKKKGIEIKKD